MVLRPGSRREAQVDRRREALLGRAEALRVAGQKRHAAAKEQQQQEKQAKAKEKLKAKREAVCAAVKPMLEKLDSTETATEEEALKLSVPELKAYIQYQSGLRTFKSRGKKGDLVAMALLFWGEEPQILESSSSEEEDDGASPGGAHRAQKNKNTPTTRRGHGKSKSRAWDPAEAFLEPDSPSDDEGDDDEEDDDKEEGADDDDDDDDKEEEAVDAEL